MSYVSVTAEVDADEVLDELSDRELSDYLKRRGGVHEPKHPMSEAARISEKLLLQHCSLPEDVKEFLDCISSNLSFKDRMLNYNLLAT